MSVKEKLLNYENVLVGYYNKYEENYTEWNEEKSQEKLEQNAIEAATAAVKKRCPSTFNDRYKKQRKYCLPHNNNTNSIDNNALVTTRPFMPPTWVSNANFDSDDSDTDRTDSPEIINRTDDQRTIVSPAANTNNININNNPNTNNNSSSCVIIQMTELAMEHQDNVRNTALLQTHSSSSDDNTGNSDSTSGNFTNENRDTRNETGTSNILVNQVNQLTMNVNLSRS